MLAITVKQVYESVCLYLPCDGVDVVLKEVKHSRGSIILFGWFRFFLRLLFFFWGIIEGTTTTTNTFLYFTLWCFC